VGAKENPRKKQYRLLPEFKVDVHSNEYRRELRDRILDGWLFAAHWADSAMTAYSIFKSWRKNYVKGDRKRKMPIAHRLFARVKQTLLKLEGDKLRLTVKPSVYVPLDLSRRYFKLPSEVSLAGLGEPVITPEKVHLPIHLKDDGQNYKPVVAWDFNLLSLDGYSPETGRIRIDISRLASVHISSFEKRRSVQRKASRSKKAKRILAKYSNRERNRAGKHQLEIARVIQSVCGPVGLEELKKQGMYTRSRIWNRRISRSDWRSITRILEGRMGEAGVKELDPYGSSSFCSRCGWENRDLNGADVFECGGCGLRIDRQLNAAINLYMRLRFGYTEKWEGGKKSIQLKMEGASQREWWDTVVLPSLLGGCVLTGAERSGTDEPVRFLYDALKPKLHYAYDRCADAYLRAPT